MAAYTFKPHHVKQFKRTGLWQNLDRSKTPIVSLLGLGGGGSNIIEVASRVLLKDPYCNEIIFHCFDFDTLELHNLNRTLIYKTKHLGVPKTGALQSSRLSIRTYDCKVDKENYRRYSVLNEPRKTRFVQLTIDARDTLDPNAMIPNSWIKMGYDGGSNISFTFHPEIAAKYIFNLNDGNSYEVVPSFYVPAAIQATLCMYFTTFQHLVLLPQELEHVGTVHFHIDDLIKQVGTTWGNEQ